MLDRLRSPLELARTPIRLCGSFAQRFTFSNSNKAQNKSSSSLSPSPQLPPLPFHDTSLVAPTCSAHRFQHTVLSTVAFIPRQIDMRCAVVLSKFLLSPDTACCHPFNLFSERLIMVPLNAGREMKSRSSGWEPGEPGIHHRVARFSPRIFPAFGGTRSPTESHRQLFTICIQIHPWKPDISLALLGVMA